MTQLIRLTAEEIAANTAARETAARRLAFEVLRDWEEALCDDAYLFPGARWTGTSAFSPTSDTFTGRNALAGAVGGAL